MNIFLHGEGNIGKSTVVREAMSRLGWKCPAGFFTHWNGAERGAATVFIETWGGARQPLARRVEHPMGLGGIPYELCAGSVDFARLALAASDETAPLVVDELGGIEQAAPEFIRAVEKALRRTGPALVVIQERAVVSWRKCLDPKNECLWLRVNASTRTTLPATIAQAVQKG